MRGRGLFISNLPYVLWLAFYFCVFSYFLTHATDEWWQALLIAVLTYSVSIPLALSSIGESLFRMAEGIRPLATSKEKNYLIPLFEEVYNQAKIKTPNINPNIQLYTSDNLFPNAFALGNSTIAVTRGLVESMTPEQIKAFIGHEFGHIVHGDTKAMILKFIGNGVFSICALAAQLYVRALMFLARLFQIGIFMTLIMSVAYLVLIPIAIGVNIAIILLREVGEIILMSVSRTNEYFADEYSYELGYGDELISGLYEFQNIYTSRKISILQQLKSTHPYLADRIQRLEALNSNTSQSRVSIPVPLTTYSSSYTTPNVSIPAISKGNAATPPSSAVSGLANVSQAFSLSVPKGSTFQQILKVVYNEYGVDVFRDTKRLKSILHDVAGDYKKEQVSLCVVLENTNIIHILTNTSESDFPIFANRIIGTIQQNCGYSEEIATKIVRSLSLIIRNMDINNFRKEFVETLKEPLTETIHGTMEIKRMFLLRPNGEKVPVERIINYSDERDIPHFSPKHPWYEFLLPKWEKRHSYIEGPEVRGDWAFFLILYDYVNFHLHIYRMPYEIYKKHKRALLKGNLKVLE